MTRSSVRRGFGRLVALALGIVALGWGAIEGAGAWRYRSELDRAGREMASGRYAPARERLERLSKRWPGRDEVEYRLGACEAALGHVDRALAAWGRVPPGSESTFLAALDRARLALQHGRLALAEECLDVASKGPGPIAGEASKLIEQLLFLSGRRDAIGARIERAWGGARDQAKLLWTHWLLDTQPIPVSAVQESLDRLGREAPDDDRIWLGRADFATRTGRFAEADEWLRRCEGRRPDDPDVWRGRLSWALASGKVGDAARAMTHLPADQFTPAEVAALAARLAALRGDAKAEREALERRAELEPGDSSAWERLAALSASEGASARVAELRGRKAEVDRLRDEYRMLMGPVASGDTSQVVELARTAEALGRRFEARGWWTLRALEAPDDREAREALDRLARPKPSAKPAGGTLADLVPGARAVAEGPSPRAEARAAIPKFRDDAEAAGLRFVYENDQSPLRRLPETMGGGVGLLDYDGDGWLDVYAVQGGRLDPGEGEAPSGDGDRLFRNRRDGSFEDVTERSGIAGFRRGYGHGVAVGDYDNDGHPDLFVTRWRSYALYRNKGDGTFEDTTDRAGLGGGRDWPTSAAFGDLDNDGDLDLYVCHYLAWDTQTSPPCVNPEVPGTHQYCVPRAFEAEPDRVYRNDRGRFTDVTAEAGVVDKDGRGLGVVIADLDDDGRQDLFVANDMTANSLFRNLGGFRFEEVGQASGAGSSGEGGYQAGMGIACGDLDGDGRPDLAVTNFYGESTSLFLNLGGGLFADRSAALGLATPTRHVLGFGAYFLDANNDGLLDLVQANGHVNDYSPSIPYAMPTQLFLGVGDGRVTLAPESAGPCWQVPRVGRGLAVGDLDNDGRQDVLVLSQGGPLAFFRNLRKGDPGDAGGHFVTLRLEGKTSNRDAVGAVVRVTTSGRTQAARRLGGGSFLSACDGRLHFGLGAGREAPTADIEVRWPGGRVDRHERLKPDAAYHLVEGEPHARPLEGWAAPR